VKASVVLDTFPKMMAACFPDVDYDINKSDWYARLQNDSQVWFGGLDEKDRTEKILGQEFATIQINEASQIPYSSVTMALTRLAQRCTYEVGGEQRELRLKAMYDCNPPSKAHWLYKLFVAKVDPETGKPLASPADYAMLFMNPSDNLANLPADYLKTLEALPIRMRVRFLEGRFGDVTEGALWSVETIDRYRTLDTLPDMQRIVVAVDPSGSGDEDNSSNDEIGIVVCGLGVDGLGYVLEDVTCKAGPATWGRLAATTYDRHRADLVVAEKNFGGDMVRFVLQAANNAMPVKVVTASRGKVVRAEPISALTEQGKIRFAGTFSKLEDELCSFTPAGYMGTNSPNRADAFVWAMSEIFPGIARPEQRKLTEADLGVGAAHGAHGWM
jgi:phage terminase large subunit-like protein